MVDPLAEIVTLLQPGAPFSKIVSGSGPWRVRRSEAGRPFYCGMLDGWCRLAAQGHEPIILHTDDFVLIPAAHDFTVSSLDLPPSDSVDTAPVALRPGEFSLGTLCDPPDVRLLVGYCRFGSPDAALLVSLLPELLLVRGESRLATLVRLVGEESRTLRPARDVIMARLLEVLFIEALRCTTGPAASPGILRGLADARLAVAIRRMHESPTRAWTVSQLAREAALSRSAFFERFRRAVGVAPMEYLLGWRMALAKDLLRRRRSVAETAGRVGYSSASTFSVAFARHVGLPPMRYVREQCAA